MAPRKRQRSENKTQNTEGEIKTEKEENLNVAKREVKKLKTKTDSISVVDETVQKETKKIKGKKAETEKTKQDKKNKHVSKKDSDSVEVESKDTNSKSKKATDENVIAKDPSNKRNKIKTSAAIHEDDVEKKSTKGKSKKTISSALPKEKVKTEAKEKKKTTIKKETAEEDESMSSKISLITREMMQKSQKWVGAHVSISGGLYKAIEEACSLESNALGLFLRSQRRWESPPLTQNSIDEFEKKIKEKKFGCTGSSSEGGEDITSSYFDSIKEQILPHGSYLINLGNPDKVKRAKSYSVFLDDLKRCDSLSIALYNFHPGSTCGDSSVEESIGLIAENINNAHKETKRVKIVIENMAGQGNVVGSKFEELSEIIKLVHDKNRIGVCLDTCHLFAAGYDVRTADAWNKTLNEFDNIVGMEYLSALHLNDSKGQLGCHKDRHECLGKGYIGLDCFKFIMEDPRFCNMPLILETPDEKLYFKEIQLLHSFMKTSPKKEEK